LGKDFQYYVDNGERIDMGFGERPIFIRENLSSVRITGAEAELVWQPVQGLLLHANYAWAQSKIVDYEAVTPSDTINLNGKFFTDVPEHIAAAGARYVHKWLSGSLLVRYNGSMYINDRNSMDEVLYRVMYPDYTTLDVKLWKDIKHIRISLGIHNLTNVKYYDSKFNVNPGRMVNASVNWQF
jgi:outer membrane receptor protein involved in Fe transport